MKKHAFEQHVQEIHQQLGTSPDIVVRRFLIGGQKEAALFFVEGLVDKQILAENLLEPMLHADPHSDIKDLTERVINTGNVALCPEFEIVDKVLAGLIAIVVEGESSAIVIDIIKWQQRGINEPKTDSVVRGPREGFCETLRINMTLMRRKLHHPGLTFEIQKHGRYSQTELALVYVKGVVDERVLKELKKRLAKIDIDAVLESGYIEQLIGDHPYSLFPTVGSSEKPDIVAAKIMEGRVGIIIDGTPIALTVPFLFVEGFQSSEDYYGRFYYPSVMRVIRFLAFFISVTLPGLFVAITCYHQQLIPSRLLLSMVSAEQETPFSVGFSVLLMGLTYEILREAGLRLPKPVGQAISIVGAIVMGDAAVSAGLISAPVLIVVAVTVIASFVTIAFFGADTSLRFLFLFAGWGLGGFGILMAGVVLVIYLASMSSFGVPYLSPLAPTILSEWRDVVIKAPLWQQPFRPRELSKNRRRMGRSSKPPGVN